MPLHFSSQLESLSLSRPYESLSEPWFLADRLYSDSWGLDCESVLGLSMAAGVEWDKNGPHGYVWKICNSCNSQF